jgi:hypothetical protein
MVVLLGGAVVGGKSVYRGLLVVFLSQSSECFRGGARCNCGGSGGGGGGGGMVGIGGTEWVSDCTGKFKSFPFGLFAKVTIGEGESASPSEAISGGADTLLLLFRETTFDRSEPKGRRRRVGGRR